MGRDLTVNGRDASKSPEKRTSGVHSPRQDSFRGSFVAAGLLGYGHIRWRCEGGGGIFGSAAAIHHHLCAGLFPPMQAALAHRLRMRRLIRRLKRDEIGLNHHRALDCCMRMIFPENRFALIRIML